MRRNHGERIGEGIMEEKTWRKNLEEKSWRRTHEEGIMEKESWRRNLEENSWRRNHGGGVLKRNHRKGIMEEESWRNHGGAIMEETSGEIWEPSGSHLGYIHLRFSPLAKEFSRLILEPVLEPVLTDF